MPPEMQRDYEVDYGKPPRHTRFAKGQSGNPRGRPAGAKNFTTLLSEALNETVTVTENGRRRKVSKREAIIAPLFNRSAMADLRATKLLFDIVRDLEHPTEPASPEAAASGEADQRGARAAQGAVRQRRTVMFETLTQAQYDVLLRRDLATFAGRCFQELNPQTCLAVNWHLRHRGRCAIFRPDRVRRNFKLRHYRNCREVRCCAKLILARGQP